MMKNNFGNCKECSLINQTLVYGDTNCKILNEVNLLIFAEAPAKEEVEQGIPLIGKAGKIFRKAFNISELINEKYYITNVVLCSNLNESGKTFNPPEDAILNCSNNWKKLIELCDPKIILIMGSIPMRVFNISDKSISKYRGRVYKYNNKYDVFLTYHPSYIARGGGLESDQGKLFLKDFNQVKLLLNNELC